MKFKKYCANVYVIETEFSNLTRFDEVMVENRYGNLVKCTIYNKVSAKNGLSYYSQTRENVNIKTINEKKAEKRKEWAGLATSQSTQKMEEAKEGIDSLCGEPIKVGHHSENRHRKLIERNDKRIGKSLELGKKAEYHNGKAEYYEEKSKEINLSIPECISYYADKLDKAEELYILLKTDKSKREHSFSLTYANNHFKTQTKNLLLAKRLWE